MKINDLKYYEQKKYYLKHYLKNQMILKCH